MKDIIFLVHGVGRHGEGWAFGEGGPVAALTETANHYDGFSEQDPLTNAIEFVEIRYDDIFDAILKRWAELALSLTNLPEATPQAISLVSQRLSEVDQPANWYAAQATDVGFYKAFRLVRRLVQLRVASRIMKKPCGSPSPTITEFSAYLLSGCENLPCFVNQYTRCRSPGKLAA